MSVVKGEKLYRALLDRLPNGALFVFDDELRYVVAAGAGLRDTGLSSEALEGKTIHDALPAETCAVIEPLYRQALAGERASYLMPYRDQIYDVHLLPLTNERGEVVAGIMMSQNVTERVRSEAALYEGEEQYRTLVENIKDYAVCALDPQGRVTLWNTGAQRVFGYDDAEITGQHFSILFTPEDRERGEPERELANTLSDGRAEDERWHVRRDGTRFWASGVTSLLRDERGRPRGFLKIARDMTEQKRAEETLRVADQRAIEAYERLLIRFNDLSQTLGTAREQVTVFRALRDFAASSMPCNGIFISLYDAARDARLAVYACADGEEVDVSALPPMPIATGPNSRAVKTGEIVITQDYATVKHGTPPVRVGPNEHLLPQSSLVAPMSVMGRLVGTIEVQSYARAAFTGEHVAALRMAASLAAIAIENMQLFEHERRARAAAEESNRLKDEFLATLSHELRTPLTAILGWTHLLRGDSFDETYRLRALETIERNAQAQTQLIDDLLDVSRVITGNLRLNVRHVQLAPIIETAIEAVRPAAEAKSIRLETTLDASAGLVSGDSHRLQQVVWNLLSNAIKFTPRGGHVAVRLERREASVRILVSDTGCGIDAAFLPHVFDRFRQADSTTTRTHGGLGLGLSIVRHLVEMHGGTVEVSSPGAGQGATFTVSLPLASERGETNGHEASSAAFNVDEATAYDVNLEGLRVLVVDDEEDAREMIGELLRQRGAEVKLAASTRDALVIMDDWQPHVLVSDIGMPGEDGYALIRQVRTRTLEQGGQVPAVALTAYALAEDRVRALAAGFHIHVPKPVEPGELVAVVASLTRRTGRVREAGS